VRDRFTYPDWVHKHDIRCLPGDKTYPGQVSRIKKGLEQFKTDDPEVSIVIPVYNEEDVILSMLSSLADIQTKYRTELLVVNNNSTDQTRKILDDCGVYTLDEKKQGISYSRQTGLDNAKGKFYLSADADSIYPISWVESLVEELKADNITCVYGRYSFIPSTDSGRFGLGIYELFAETIFTLRRKNKDYLNVMGFNFAFRRKDGYKVGGFNTDRQRWQDGWMAMQLEKLGKIKLIKKDEARVWTSDRRLIQDGSLTKAFWRRIMVHSGKLKAYMLPGTQGLGNEEPADPDSPEYNAK
jgi:glycosyltransferase involved in cell wall biosynthesis